MARLPDRFDLWVRHARQCPDAARQADYVLSALAALPEWVFLNLGSAQKPQPAEAEIEGTRHLILFSGPDRLDDLTPSGRPLPKIAIPTTAAISWCLERRLDGIAGLLVNPGDDAFAVSLDQLEAFHTEWTQRGGRQSSGFWIPNLTTEEEDFWQEHGL
ncbi:MAG: hypothetical protein LV479_00825 [Methylacidiphilales bacterium]|nr:hypothetical protein [Candidatus Methylacidiphilales bacterium]